MASSSTNEIRIHRSLEVSRCSATCVNKSRLCRDSTISGAKGMSHAGFKPLCFRVREQALTGGRYSNAGYISQDAYKRHSMTKTPGCPHRIMAFMRRDWPRLLPRNSVPPIRTSGAFEVPGMPEPSSMHPTGLFRLEFRPQGKRTTVFKIICLCRDSPGPESPKNRSQG